MRQLALSLLICLLATVSLHGQASKDIKFGALFYDNGVQADTLQIGKQYELRVSFENLGDAIPAGTSLSFYWAAQPIDQFPPADTLGAAKSVKGDSTFSLPPLKSRAKGHFSFPIEVTDSFKPNEFNIVIIWPTESYSDDNASNNVSSRPYYILPRDTSTSVAPSPSAGITIRPNPSSSFFEIRAQGAELAEMYNLHGKKLWKADIKNGTAILNMQDIGSPASGVYLIRVVSAAGTSVQKILYQP